MLIGVLIGSFARHSVVSIHINDILNERVGVFGYKGFSLDVAVSHDLIRHSLPDTPCPFAESQSITDPLERIASGEQLFKRKGDFQVSTKPSRAPNVVVVPFHGEVQQRYRPDLHTKPRAIYVICHFRVIRVNTAIDSSLNIVRN